MDNIPDKGLLDVTGAIEKLGMHDHLCLICETQEKQFSAVIPIMKIGLERGEKCLYIVDDNTAAVVVMKKRFFKRLDGYYSGLSIRKTARGAHR